MFLWSKLPFCVSIPWRGKGMGFQKVASASDSHTAPNASTANGPGHESPAHEVTYTWQPATCGLLSRDLCPGGCGHSLCPGVGRESPTLGNPVGPVSPGAAARFLSRETWVEDTTGKEPISELSACSQRSKAAENMLFERCANTFYVKHRNGDTVSQGHPGDPKPNPTPATGTVCTFQSCHSCCAAAL